MALLKTETVFLLMNVVMFPVQCRWSVLPVHHYQANTISEQAKVTADLGARTLVTRFLFGQVVRLYQEVQESLWRFDWYTISPNIIMFILLAAWQEAMIYKLESFMKYYIHIIVLTIFKK